VFEMIFNREGTHPLFLLLMSQK